MIFIPKDFDDEFLFYHFGAYILETIFFHEFNGLNVEFR